MYESMNGTGVSRLPRTKADVPAAASETSTFGKTIATTAVQALVLVAAVKLVEVVIDLAVAQFRKPQQHEPGRARQEEMAA